MLFILGQDVKVNNIPLKVSNIATNGYCRIWNPDIQNKQ